MFRTTTFRAAPFCLLTTFIACAPTEVFNLQGELSATPAALDFADRPIFSDATKTIVISNVGTLAFTLETPTFAEGSDAAFSFDLAETIVPPGGATPLIVRFAPTEVRPHQATLVITTDDPRIEPLVIAIAGAAVEPCVVVDPTVINFGSVRVGTPKTESVIIRNDCKDDARLNIALEQNVRTCTNANDPAPYCLTRSTDDIVSAPEGFALPAGAAVSIDVVFNPTSPSIRERGNIVVRFCDGATCSTNVRFEGVGVERALVCRPATLDFGAVNPGSCRALTAICENVANVGVTIPSWRIVDGAGASATAFEAGAAMPIAVAPGEQHDIDVRYCPPDLGDHAARLVIDTDERPQTISLALEGTGGGPDIDINPRSLDFGQVSTLSPARRSVLVTNVGFDPLLIEGLVFDDTSGAFRIVDPPTAAILPGGSTIVTVEFLPVAVGPASTRLVIQSNDADEPEVTVDIVGVGVNLGPCTYEVRPTNLTFGVVERGRTLARAIEVRNVGATECLLTGVRIVTNDNGAFRTTHTTTGSIEIGAGASTTVTFEFTPSDVGTFGGVAELGLSSPSEPYATIIMSGLAGDVGLLIAPHEVDFGTIGIGCAARQRLVTIYNTGAAAVTIDRVGPTVETTAFSVRNLPATPFILSAGAQLELAVDFTAAAASRYAGAIEIETTVSGMPSTYVVPLVGEGANDAVQTDLFTQVPAPKSDILFVIDNSCSMGEEQAAIAANFSSFIQFAVAQNLDYQIAVITTDVGDGGRFVPLTGNAGHRIVTADTQPTPEQIFSQNVTLGVNGSGFEQGLESARLALSAPAIHGHNAGFLRSDAQLAVIFVSDEEDQSLDTVNFYTNFFRSLKGAQARHLFTASAIVSESPACPTAITPGARYTSLAQQTGGVFQSICTASWQRALQDIATTAFGFRTRFILSNQPVRATLEVYVDDALIPPTGAGGTVNYRFAASANAVDFTPFAAPEPGAEIRIEYGVDCL